MIRAVMVINTLGKPRLSKFYDFLSAEKQQELMRTIYSVLCSRPGNVSNFIDVEFIFGPDTRLVYKHFATLYFVFVFDSAENELAMLDLIQVFVETLEKCFRNVCELDIVLNYSKCIIGGRHMSPAHTVTSNGSLRKSCEQVMERSKMHTILDEIIVGGQVLETDSAKIMNAMEEMSKLETATNANTNLVSRSASFWRGR